MSRSSRGSFVMTLAARERVACPRVEVLSLRFIDEAGERVVVIVSW